MQKPSNNPSRLTSHSLNNKKSPYYTPPIKNDPHQKIDKISTRCFKQTMPNLQKLIMEIKISPLPDLYQQHIKSIFCLLKSLESNALVIDQVNAVYLLMQSIQNKVNNANKANNRINNKSNTKKNSIATEQKENSQISPIKLIEQASSRILYTNFSLKQIQKRITQSNGSTPSQKHSQSINVSIQKFDELQDNQEINKLNKQIKYLQILLANKTKENYQYDRNFSKKKKIKFC